MKVFRTIITTSDIVCLTGRSSRYAQRMMREMLEFFGKNPKQFITFNEFSIYTGIGDDEINAYLEKLG